MFLDLFRNLASRLARWRRRFRPCDTFSDGSSLTEIHRYAIRYQAPDGRFVDVGFDADVSRSYVWVIHESTVARWHSPRGLPIEVADKQLIIDRIVEYCVARKLKYVIEQ
ncbi:MAG: hypothetical protein K0Q76_4321 [Panacagrimonas sp.]|jgi:hypothetical protein|nr:hypothetical protein [Panacagrimonas sp.]MCC2659213.1 hypothetical protein [Panacagrimonas sp.]